jgi:beta-glucanase (GH16 family)
MVARLFNSAVMAVMVAGASLFFTQPGEANVLSNAGFESDPAGPNQTILGWTSFGPNGYSETSSASAHSGTNYFKVYQSFNGETNFTGIYQDYISGPGASYSATGWAFNATNDLIAGQNAAWLEVTFRDSSANILALYRSRLITTNALATGGFFKNTWISLPITNQYDLNTYQITNTSETLLAPSGTVFARFQIVFQGDPLYSAGSVYFDDLSFNQTGGSPYGNMNIVWSDEFNSNSINPKIWTYDTGNGGWGNNELENYTSRTNNAFEGGGYLHIIAKAESYEGSSFTSARIKSEGLFSWEYGRIEWRAQLPEGVAFWPALWLLGVDISSIGWPECGEIDVMENNGSYIGTVQGSVHSGSDETGYYSFPGSDSVTSFHTYTLDWTTNAIMFYVDGHLYENQSNWTSSAGSYPFPFNQPFFIIMNLAIGGNYLGNPTIAAIDAGSVFPAELRVDYVRIYQTTDPLRLAVKQTKSGPILSWPANIVCHLEVQTNDPSIGFATNWVTVAAATNQIQIRTSAGGAYYRLASP